MRSIAKPILELDFVSPWTLRLAAEAGRSVRVRFRAPRECARSLPEPGALRVQRASLVGTSVTVLCHDAPLAAAPDEDVLIGASDVAWRASREHESWRMRSRPLARSHWGRVDRSRGWALVAPDVVPHRSLVEQVVSERDLQVHFVGTRGWPSRDAVRWVVGPAGLASLLGRVSVVFAGPGPLAWDAARAGALVIDPTPADPVRDGLALRRLARVVPHPLATDAEFFRRLCRELLVGRPRATWSSSAWLAEACARPDPRGSRIRRVSRKLMKLRRDPIAFFGDSWLPFARRLSR